jgi:cysteine desulfurase
VARHYLDHASASPLRPTAAKAMTEAVDRVVGDPGRIHAEGMAARAALEQARDEVAALVGSRSREVVFTSGATEAIAMATWGAAERGGHQVVAPVEHSAVRQCAARSGAVTEVDVDRDGRVDPAEVLSSIRSDTALVHVQWANHEVGSRQPVAEIVAGCRDRAVLVHVDAAQGVGHDPVDFGSLGADLLSLSGPKFGGPFGTGALLVRRGLRLRSLLLGGDQERARRAGLENLFGAVGLGAAAHDLAEPDRLADEAAAARRLTDRLATALGSLPGVTAFGHPTDRAPHLVCFGIEGVEPQAVLLGLDQAGIAAHSGSACATESLEPSPVLAAMGVDAERSLRLSVGWSTTDADIDAVLAALPPVLERLRALSGA